MLLLESLRRLVCRKDDIGKKKGRSFSMDSPEMNEH
jgi:hypothetical protein